MNKILAVALILVGYAGGQTTKTPSVPKPLKRQYAAADVSPAGGHTGRYQIFFSPHARADVYLVDTESGKIWRPVTITNAKDVNLKGAAPEIWLYQERIDTESEFNVWLALHTPPAAAAPQ